MSILFLFAAAAAQQANDPVRFLEGTDGPVIHSTTDDLIHAWQDCVAATQDRDLAVDEAALRRGGWVPTMITHNGKPIGPEPQFYSRADVNAIIVADQACTVEGLTADENVVEKLKAAIEPRVASLAVQRRVKPESSSYQGNPVFSAKAFNVVIYYPTTGHSLLQIISRNLVDTKPVRIMTVDATGPKR